MAVDRVRWKRVRVVAVEVEADGGVVVGGQVWVSPIQPVVEHHHSYTFSCQPLLPGFLQRVQF